MASRAPALSTATRPIRLLIVDDSAVARAVLARMIASDPAFEIASTVSSADAALAFLSGSEVDVVLLDIEMPGLDGLTALPAIIAASRGARVLIVSSSAEEGATATMRALTLGAADTLAKPGAGAFGGRFAAVLVERLLRLGHAPRAPRPAPAAAAPEVKLRPLCSGPIDCLAIGASTGGLHALSQLLRALPPRFDAPILVTQHLPASFMPYFAAQIAEVAKRPAAIAQEGARLRRGQICVAPGDGHLAVVKSGASASLLITREPAASGCMPSVDPMLASVGEVFATRGVGVILTGMGRDGTAGAERMSACGGDILAQSRDSSVIWGMPGSAAAAGVVSALLAPHHLAELIGRRWALAA